MPGIKSASHRDKIRVPGMLLTGILEIGVLEVLLIGVLLLAVAVSSESFIASSVRTNFLFNI